MILSVQSVSKAYGPLQAVDNVSFEIEKGRICGFLGPNGAGKTSLIRMIMDIIAPDSGTISLGEGLADRRNHIGYLPEERGLYINQKVMETLLYFGQLKGLTLSQARTNAEYFLDLLGMTPVADKKIRKLSKGNQQKIQFINTVISKPRLLIMDEPFSGLDPINTKLVSDLLLQLKAEGTSVVLSTHQMNQVESFCDDILLINRGKLILQGPLQDIVARYSGRFVLLEGPETLPESPLFDLVGTERDALKIELKGSMKALLSWLGESDFEVTSVRPYRMPVSEIFIHEVNRGG